MRLEPARSSNAAVNRFVAGLKPALSCLGLEIWVVKQQADGKRGSLSISQPVRLRRTNGPPLLLEAIQRFEVIPETRTGEGDWKVTTREYIYTVYTSAGGAHAPNREVLRWDWHPAKDVKHPHIHVLGSEDVESALFGRSLGRLHVPTERVAFEQVVRFLITDLQVQPHRQDWEDLLTASEASFARHRTWPIGVSLPE